MLVSCSLAAYEFAATNFVIAGLIKRFVPKSVWDQLFTIFSEGTLA